MMGNTRQEKIIDLLRTTYQGASTELDYGSAYQLLVATMMAAQSTDKQVNHVTKDLFVDYGNPSAMASLSWQALAEKIKGVGIYRNKSKSIVATSKIILEEFDGQVPQTLEELISLPGVGRKTANVVLSNAFDILAFAVDTHVFRTSRRLGLARGKNPEEVEQELMEVFAEEEWKDAHHWLIYHGRRQCTARRPKCADCPLFSLCESEDKLL